MEIFRFSAKDKDGNEVSLKDLNEELKELVTQFIAREVKRYANRKDK